MILGMILWCCLFTIVGTIFGYHWGTGMYPFTVTQSVLPPVIGEATTVDNITSFLESDDTETNEYTEGFNCVEFALLAARNAIWEGLPAGVCNLQYPDGTGHMMLIFPTVDNTWVFVEPQTDSIVYPEVGKNYMGKRVTGIYILNMSWNALAEEAR